MLLAGRCFRLAQKEQGKEEARGEANVKKNFDKYLLFSNIRELLKNSDVKIGEIEKQAGCYPGYMSRLDKKDNTTEPSVEFVMTAAKLLNTSVDIISTCDLRALTPTEGYLTDFFNKLDRDTLENKLDWKIDSPIDLNDLETDDGGYTGHPLFFHVYYEEKDQNGEMKGVHRVLFKSRNFGNQTYITENCFELKMKKFSRLYLMNVGKKTINSSEFDDTAREIWLVNIRDEAEFLASNKENSSISLIVDTLFDTVMGRMKRPNIKKEFRSIIDAYFNGDLGENDKRQVYVPDPNEIPF